MNPRFDLIDTPLDGLTVLQRRPLNDSRGWLERLFCADELTGLMGGRPVAQVNRTMTVATGTMRGMHFQHPPHSDAKIVTCLKGRVFDVAVDLRRGSRTFLQWYGIILDGREHRSLLIPEGFAHGFQTLTSDCEMLYFHSAAYVPAAEGGVNACDPRLAIAWPLAIAEQSPRDRDHPLLTDDFAGIPL